MAMYDTAGEQKYVEGKMSEARDYREKQAAKQEKFSKRLQMADWAITGANFVINKKADALEADRVTERAHYTTALANSKKWQDMYTQYEDLGYTREQMFFEEKKKQLNTHLQKELGEGFSLVNYEPGVDKIAREFSDKQVNFESWNKALDAQLNIPNLTSEELGVIIRKDGAAPRSIASFLGNKMLKVAKSHDKDTLKNEDTKETKAMLGGLIGEKFESAKVALKDHKAKGNPINELVAWMKTEEGKAIVSVKDTNVSVQMQEKQDKFGNTKKVPVVITTGVGRDGIGKPIGAYAIDSIASTAEGPEYSPTSQEIKFAVGEINTYITKIDDDNITDNYEDFYSEAEEKEGLAKNVLITARKIRRNDKEGTIDQGKAIQIATQFLLGQETELYDTNMSLYDIAKIDKTVPVDTDNIESFVTSIKETKPKYTWNQEITIMRDDFFANIDVSKLDEDAKQEAKQDINMYLESIGIKQDIDSVQEVITTTVEDEYTQRQIEKGIPERDTRLKITNNLRNEISSLNDSLNFIDKSTLTGTEYKEAEKQIAKNKIKAEAFEKKFNIQPNNILKDLYSGTEYTNDLLNEMIEFLNS
tara:strand:+ start:4544 stop:6310 length:1767 start_codon:yes stop_codon:yes gene_type:complete